MILIRLSQGNWAQYLPLVDTLEDAHALLQQIDDLCMLDEDGYCFSFPAENLGNYSLLSLNGAQIPLSKFSFVAGDSVDVDLFSLPLLSQVQGLAEGATKVDAYVVDNADLLSYIEKREQNYAIVKERLLEKGIEVERSFQGSEDGEAIVLKNVKGRYFFCHMDPGFVEDFPKTEEGIRQWIEDQLN